jgi:hypothetical protein
VEAKDTFALLTCCIIVVLWVLFCHTKNTSLIIWLLLCAGAGRTCDDGTCWAGVEFWTQHVCLLFFRFVAGFNRRYSSSNRRRAPRQRGTTMLGDVLLDREVPVVTSSISRISRFSLSEVLIVVGLCACLWASVSVPCLKKIVHVLNYICQWYMDYT